MTSRYHIQILGEEDAGYFKAFASENDLEINTRIDTNCTDVISWSDYILDLTSEQALQVRLKFQPRTFKTLP